MAVIQLIAKTPVFGTSKGQGTYESSALPYDMTDANLHRAPADAPYASGSVCSHRGRSVFGLPVGLAVDVWRGRYERMYPPRDAVSNTAWYQTYAGPYWYVSGDKAFNYGGRVNLTYAAPVNAAFGRKPLIVRDLVTGAHDVHFITWSPAGLTYRTYVVLGGYGEWILLVLVFANAMRVLAVSRANPSVYAAGRDFAELQWLCDAVELYGLGRDYSYAAVMRSIGAGDYTRYAYLASQNNSVSNGYQLEYGTALFVDFAAKKAWQVATGYLGEADNVIVAGDGRMYQAAGFMPRIVDPFARVIHQFPLLSWKALESKYQRKDQSWRAMVSETEMFVSISASSAGREAGLLFDIYADTCISVGQPDTNFANLNSVYPFHDDAGNIYAASTLSTSAGGITTAHNLWWLGTFGRGSVYPAADALRQSLGVDGRRWKLLAANVLTDGVRSVRTAGLLNGTLSAELDPLGTITTSDEGRALRVVGGVFRAAPLNAAPLPPPDLDGDVAAIDIDGAYASLPEPRPLPDWFNGCTPVVDDGQWRAGDVIDRLPANPGRDNVTWCSRSRRWEPRGLPFTVLNASILDAFPFLEQSLPAYYIYASGAFVNWASETAPHVTGATPGLVKPLPDPLIDCYGIRREELGITGNYTNNYWTGSETLSNRPLTLFNSVVNTGTGRWEVGDVIEPLWYDADLDETLATRQRLDDISDSWHRLDDLTTVNRIDDHNLATLWGEEHRELYFMLARFMSRMWMRTVIGQYVPVSVVVQTSVDPGFDPAAGVVEVRTGAGDNPGWYFEHSGSAAGVSGGQSPFLATGPTATTVIGVVFDPATAGVDYDLNRHYSRYKITVGGVESPDWLKPEFIHTRDRWWNIQQVENQTSVNHFVLPRLVNRGWLFSKEPVVPIGGARVFIPLAAAADDEVTVEVEIGDSVTFLAARTERRSTGDSTVGFSVIIDGVESPYPADQVFTSAAAGQVVFDPVAAAVSSRVGSRFWRYRLTVNGVIGRWTVRATSTCQSNQVRLDMLNVIGSEEMRADDGPIAMVRDSGNRTIVTDRDVIPANDLPLVDGDHIVPPHPSPGAATVLAHGVYRSNTVTENYWRHTAALQIANRHYRGRPPMYDEQVHMTYRQPQGVAFTTYCFQNGLNTNYLPGVVSAVMGYGSASHFYTAVRDAVPGSANVGWFSQAAITGEYTGLPDAYGVWDEDDRFYCFSRPDGLEHGVWDRVLHTTRIVRVGDYHRINQQPFCVRHGLFLLPGASGVSSWLVIDPRSLAHARVGARSAVGLYEDYRVFGENAVRAYFPGLGRFLAAYPNRRYAPCRFIGIDGDYADTDYLNCAYAIDGGAIPDIGAEFGVARWSKYIGSSYGANRGCLAGLYLRHGLFQQVFSRRDYSSTYPTFSGALFTRFADSVSFYSSLRPAAVAPVGVPGTFAQASSGVPNGDTNVLCQSYALAPGCSVLSAPANGSHAYQNFNFAVWNALHGWAESHNVDRLGFGWMYSGSSSSNLYHFLPGFLSCYYTAENVMTATSGHRFILGDVFPALTSLKGDLYARLEIGQSIGR